MVTEMLQSPRQDSSNGRAADSSDGKKVSLLIGNVDPPLTEILGAFGREALADQCELVMFLRQRKPRLVLLEDLQWAESESLELLDRLYGTVESVPVLSLGNYREEE